MDKYEIEFTESDSSDTALPTKENVEATDTDHAVRIFWAGRRKSLGMHGLVIKRVQRVSAAA